jgi:hypothetical protein
MGLMRTGIVVGSVLSGGLAGLMLGGLVTGCVGGG